VATAIVAGHRATLITALREGPWPAAGPP